MILRRVLLLTMLSALVAPVVVVSDSSAWAQSPKPRRITGEPAVEVERAKKEAAAKAKTAQEAKAKQEAAARAKAKAAQEAKAKQEAAARAKAAQDAKAKQDAAKAKTTGSGSSSVPRGSTLTDPFRGYKGVKPVDVKRP